MTEDDGYAMMLARSKALEELLLDYLTLYMYETATDFLSEHDLKFRMEKMVERKAPGCGHFH